MIKRRFGRTGYDVSIMGLGGAHAYMADKAEFDRLIARAIERGVNFFDTYHNGEERFGECIKQKRDKCVIGIKVSVQEDMARDPSLGGDTTAEIEASLKRLAVDCIDLCQLHGVMDEKKLEEVLRPGGIVEKIQRAQSEGKVRFIGITGHYPATLVKAIKTGIFDTVMVPFNIMRRPFGTDPSSGLFSMAKENDIGMIIMKPISSGRIIKNLPKALKFILAHEITVAIPGAQTVADLDRDVDIAEEFSALSAGEQLQSGSLDALFEKPYCNGCGYCLPCPAEMRLPELMQMEQTCRTFGLSEWIRPEEIGPLTIDTDKCDSCGSCEARCPLDIPIRQALEAGKQYLVATA